MFKPTQNGFTRISPRSDSQVAEFGMIRRVLSVGRVHLGIGSRPKVPRIEAPRFAVRNSLFGVLCDDFYG